MCVVLIGDIRLDLEVLSRDAKIIPLCMLPMKMLLLMQSGLANHCPLRHNGNLLLAAGWMVQSILGVMNLLPKVSKWLTLGKVNFPGKTSSHIPPDHNPSAHTLPMVMVCMILSAMFGNGQLTGIEIITQRTRQNLAVSPSTPKAELSNRALTQICSPKYPGKFSRVVHFFARLTTASVIDLRRVIQKQ